jgi:hypothetical protein
MGTRERRTPLMHYVQAGCQEASVKVLIQAGAQLNVINEEGRTVLDMLDDYEGEQCEAVRKSLQKGGAKRALELIAESEQEL